MSRVLGAIHKLLKQFTKSERSEASQMLYISSSSGTIDGVTLFRLFKFANKPGKLLKIYSLLTVSLATVAVANMPVRVSIEKGQEMTHLEFSNRDIWDYKIVKTSENQISFDIDKLDDKSLVELKTLSTDFIEKIDIQEGVDLKHKVTVTLKKGAASFDYITDQPTRLVLDFFKQEPKPVAQQTSAVNSKKLAKTLPAKKQRKPASELLAAESKKEDPKKNSALLDGADPEYKRFQIADYDIKDSAIIASSLNLYIEFPMMTVPNKELEILHNNPNRYSFPVEESDENKKVRLLLTLFYKGKEDSESPEKIIIEKPRTAVFLKALELFRKDYPNSKYSETLRFMEADTYYYIWQKNKNPSDFDYAISMYTKILLDIPNSPLHERTARLISYAYFNKKDYINALKWLQSYQTKYPNSPENLRTQMSIGESFSYLGNLQEAEKVFDSIEKNKDAGVFAVEASFRKGDAYALAANYLKAVAAYEESLKKYDVYKMDYPNAYYNTAESRFWLTKERANLKRSLDDYIEFLRKFPKATHASYAVERAGELLEILGADESKYNGAFLETIYRYPGSQASEIAKIRLLRARIKNMKEEDIKDEVSKISEFVKNSQLPKLKEFRTIMISDGYYEKKDYEKTLSELIAFYQENPLSNYLDIFKKRIVKTFRDQMIHTIDNGDYLKTFQIYGRNAGTWLKDSNRLDIEYLLGEAFEKTGVPDEAITKYKKVLNTLYAIKGTQEEKERNVFEILPNTDELNLRLASTHIFKNEYSKALDFLKQTQEDNLSKEENKVERVYLSSIVHEKLGDRAQALKDLKDLTESWRGQPDKLAKIYLRLSQLQSQSNQNIDAMKAINVLINMANDSAVIEEGDLVSAYQLKAELSLKLKNSDDAVESYRTLLDKFEEKRPLYSSRYNLGKIYFDQGNLKEAEKVWSPLADRPEAQLWSRLAQENLKNRNWNDDYKKYTNRIPAMANDKKSNSSTGDRR